jgi:hypothetical protein
MLQFETLENRYLLHHCSVSFSAASYTVDEGGGTATITLQRDFAAGDISVDFNAAVGSAGSADFTPISSQTVSWLNSDSNEKTVEVTIAQDDLPEGDETIQLSLDNFQSVFQGDITEATLTITDDDAAQNAAPTLGSFGGGITYFENALAKTISSTVTVADPDSANLASGKLTVSIANNAHANDRLAITHQGTGAGQIGRSGSNVTFGGETIGTFTGGSGATPLVVTFNSAATPTAAQAVARAITFRTLGDAPSTLARSITFKVTDGDGGTSNTVSKSATVVAVNDAPRLDNTLSPTLASIVEDATNPAGTKVSTLLTGAVTDPDAGAKRGIAITGASSTLGVWQFTLDNGVTWTAMGSVSASAARLLPSDSVTKVRFIPKANFNGQVSLFYRAWDQTQGQAGETLTTSGNLGGTRSMSTAAESATLVVTPVNDRPVLGGISGSGSYARNTSAIVLASAATVTDIDSANFSTGRLRVRITGTVNASNRLAIGAGFTVNASNQVFLGTKQIGQRTSGGFGTSDLIVTFNANATPSIVQQLVRAITFKTVDGVAGARQVRFSVTDGDGGTSAELTKAVNVT